MPLKLKISGEEVVRKKHKQVCFFLETLTRVSETGWSSSKGLKIGRNVSFLNHQRNNDNILFLIVDPPSNSGPPTFPAPLWTQNGVNLFCFASNLLAAGAGSWSKVVRKCLEVTGSCPKVD